MKDYYQILEIPDNASQEDIKRAFRKLAFKYHPDTNPGNEKQAEEQFKEINEAYGVLGDEGRRRQYDFARKAQFAGVGYDTKYQGFQYSQQDIFRNIFSNPAMFDELNRMFSQGGLRFDQDFLNRIFFQGEGFVFQFSAGPGGISRRVFRFGSNIPYQSPTDYKPNWREKLLGKVGKAVLRKLFGFGYEPLPKQNLDQHIELEISQIEASIGGEKQVSYKHSKQTKKLVVKIPSRVKSGTKIRLRGMGITENNTAGDLYLHIKVKG